MIASSESPVYHDGRLIGTIHHGELQQTRRPSNFLRWGISYYVGVMAEVDRLGANRVRIKNGDTHEVFCASIAAIRQYGKPINHGYGEQIAMPWAYWQRSGATTKANEPTKQPKPIAEVVAAQLSLWGAS